MRLLCFFGPDNNNKDQTELDNIKGVLSLAAQHSYKTFPSTSENQKKTPGLWKKQSWVGEVTRFLFQSLSS